MLTLADLTLASSLMYAQQTQVPLGEHPHIQAWFSRISALDGWKKSAPWRREAKRPRRGETAIGVVASLDFHGPEFP